MANIPGRLAKLIDELIRKGVVKNEDEAVEYLNKQATKYGEKFIMLGEKGEGGALVPQGQKAMTATEKEAVQTSATAPSTQEKSRTLDRLRGLVDDLIKRGVVKDEDEAYENIIKSKKFGEDFKLRDKNEPATNPPARVERDGKVLHTPASEPDEILDGSEKGLVKSRRRIDVQDAEFEDDTLKPVVAGQRYTYNTAKGSSVEERVREAAPKEETKPNVLKKLLPTLPFLLSSEAGDRGEYKGPLRPETPATQPEKPKAKDEGKAAQTSIEPPKEIKEAFGYNPQKESVSQYLKRIGQLEDALKSGIKYNISDDDKKLIADSREQLASNLNKIQQDFKEAVQQANNRAAQKEAAARWGQVIESVGHGLAQIAAGVYGLKHGVDASSGVKFSKNDWQAEFDRILKEVEQRRREALDAADMKLKDYEAQREQLNEFERKRYQEARDEAMTKYKTQADELSRMYGIMGDIQQRNMAAENRAREFEAEAKLRKSLADEANELKRQLGEARLEAQKLKEEKKKDDTKEKDLAKKKAEYDEAMGRLTSGEVDKKEYDVVLGKINQYLFELGATPEQIQEIQESTSGFFKSRGSEQKDLAKELKALERQLQSSSPAGSTATIPAGMVLVVDKDGRKGMIPADKLREAEARGYRRIDK